MLILVLGVIGLVWTLAALDARTAAGSTTFAGFAAEDTVPPSIAVLSTKLFRLRYPRGVYSLRLRVVIRDDVDGNPVGYTVVVKGGKLALARKIGTTASGTISLALRIRPRRASRSIRVVVTAIDPVGNEASLTRTVRLPRQAYGERGPRRGAASEGRFLAEADSFDRAALGGAAS